MGGEGNPLRRLLVALTVGEAANYTETGVVKLTGFVRSKLAKEAPASQKETRTEASRED